MLLTRFSLPTSRTISNRLLRFFSVVSVCLGLFAPAAVHAQNSPTSADAVKAYDAFNEYFYDPEAKLYHSTTKRDHVAAIWTQAIYWDLAMHVYERTKNPAQRQLIADIYAGNAKQYAGYDWTNHTVWFIYDDMMWWVMALARAYELTGNRTYLQQSIDGFKHVWDGSYDPVDGGMYWDFKHSGKNACINYPTVIAAVRLYKITGDKAYLTKAENVYGWSRANLFNESTGRVADHKAGNKPPGYEDYTYNQGTCIGAAAALYKVTKKADYLADARLAADYTKDKMSKNGVLPTEGDYNEQGVLKAIFAQYIMQLIGEMGQKQYLPWIESNIKLGWQNRDPQRNLTYRNYDVPCPIGDIQSYEASSIVTFMQLYRPGK